MATQKKRRLTTQQPKQTTFGQRKLNNYTLRATRINHVKFGSIFSNVKSNIEQNSKASVHCKWKKYRHKQSFVTPAQTAVILYNYSMRVSNKLINASAPWHLKTNYALKTNLNFIKKMPTFLKTKIKIKKKINKQHFTFLPITNWSNIRFNSLDYTQIRFAISAHLIIEQDLYWVLGLTTDCKPFADYTSPLKFEPTNAEYIDFIVENREYQQIIKINQFSESNIHFFKIKEKWIAQIFHHTTNQRTINFLKSKKKKKKFLKIKPTLFVLSSTYYLQQYDKVNRLLLDIKQNVYWHYSLCWRWEFKHFCYYLFFVFFYKLYFKCFFSLIKFFIYICLKLNQQWLKFIYTEKNISKIQELILKLINILQITLYKILNFSNWNIKQWLLKWIVYEAIFFELESSIIYIDDYFSISFEHLLNQITNYDYITEKTYYIFKKKKNLKLYFKQTILYYIKMCKFIQWRIFYLSLFESTLLICYLIERFNDFINSDWSQEILIPFIFNIYIKLIIIICISTNYAIRLTDHGFIAYWYICKWLAYIIFFWSRFSFLYFLYKQANNLTWKRWFIKRRSELLHFKWFFYKNNKIVSNLKKRRFIFWSVMFNQFSYNYKKRLSRLWWRYHTKLKANVFLRPLHGSKLLTLFFSAKKNYVKYDKIFFLKKYYKINTKYRIIICNNRIANVCCINRYDFENYIFIKTHKSKTLLFSNEVFFFPDEPTNIFDKLLKPTIFPWGDLWLAAIYRIELTHFINIPAQYFCEYPDLWVFFRNWFFKWFFKNASEVVIFQNLNYIHWNTHNNYSRLINKQNKIDAIEKDFPIREKQTEKLYNFWDKRLQLVYDSIIIVPTDSYKIQFKKLYTITRIRPKMLFLEKMLQSVKLFSDNNKSIWTMRYKLKAWFCSPISTEKVVWRTARDLQYKNKFNSPWISQLTVRSNKTKKRAWAVTCKNGIKSRYDFIPVYWELRADISRRLTYETLLRMKWLASGKRVETFTDTYDKDETLTLLSKFNSELRYFAQCDRVWDKQRKIIVAMQQKGITPIWETIDATLIEKNFKQMQNKILTLHNILSKQLQFKFYSCDDEYIRPTTLFFTIKNYKSLFCRLARVTNFVALEARQNMKRIVMQANGQCRFFKTGKTSDCGTIWIDDITEELPLNFSNQKTLILAEFDWYRYPYIWDKGYQLFCEKITMTKLPFTKTLNYGPLLHQGAYIINTSITKEENNILKQKIKNRSFAARQHLSSFYYNKNTILKANSITPFFLVNNLTSYKSISYLSLIEVIKRLTLTWDKFGNQTYIEITANDRKEREPLSNCNCKFNQNLNF